MRSLASNSILFTIKTICSMVFPLVTFPYISRVLLDTGVGAFNFSNSFISYFSLLAGLGVFTYGVREGARVRDDKKSFSALASELFTINVLSSLLSIALMLACVFFIPAFSGYKALILVIAASIPLATIGMEWVFSACEDYLYITVRSIAAQVVAIVLMFIFVKSSDDTLVYAILTVASTYGTNLINFALIQKKYSVRIVFRKEMLRHLQPILILFASAVASQIYINSDILILGLVKGDAEVGIYSAASKVYNLVRSLLSAFLTVLLPRMMYQKNNEGIEAYRGFWRGIKDLYLGILIPAAAGILILAEPIVLLLSGDAFIDAALPLVILSVSMIFSCAGTFVANSVLLVYAKENVLMWATIVGAVTNLVLNCAIIPFLGATGAALTTLISEMLVFYIQYYHAKKESTLKMASKNLVKSFIGALAMVAVIIILKYFVENIFVELLVCIAAGMLVYGVCLIITRHDMFGMVKSMLAIRLHGKRSSADE